MRLALPLALSAVVLALTAVSPASAAERQERPFLLETDLPRSACLDSNASGNAYLGDCYSGNPYMRWTWVSSGKYRGMLRSVGTGRCLDSNASGDVYTSECHANNNYENWIYWNEGNKRFSFENVATGLCLSSNYSLDPHFAGPTRVFTQDCSGAVRWLARTVS
ncbi:RICIN domain-containing protein [Streptomyces sp. C10]|uniref:RICIN domain-containing protein n=1 Tax=Streptomyces sp. C10 TaxID=531941 RepID=UPI003981865B